MCFAREIVSVNPRIIFSSRNSSPKKSAANVAKAPAQQTGMEEVVKVHYIVRCSEPLWPRVMRRFPVRGRRSVGAGLRRRGIELRNHPFGASTLYSYGEDNTVRSARRGAYRPTESETLCMRRSSMRGSRESPEATERVPRAVRLGKVCDRNRESVCDRAVGQAHSTREAVEQRSATGRPATDRRRWWRKGALTEGNSFKPSTHRTQRRRERYGEP